MAIIATTASSIIGIRHLPTATTAIDSRIRAHIPGHATEPRPSFNGRMSQLSVVAAVRSGCMVSICSSVIHQPRLNPSESIAAADRSSVGNPFANGREPGSGPPYVQPTRSSSERTKYICLSRSQQYDEPIAPTNCVICGNTSNVRG